MSTEKKQSLRTRRTELLIVPFFHSNGCHLIQNPRLSGDVTNLLYMKSYWIQSHQLLPATTVILYSHQNLNSQFLSSYLHLSPLIPLSPGHSCFPSPQTIQTTQVSWRPGGCEVALQILYMHHSTGCPAAFSHMWVDSVMTCDNLKRTHNIIHFLQRAHSSKHLMPFIVFLNIDGVKNILHLYMQHFPWKIP